MFYFSTPLYVSFAHIKATNAHSTVSPIIIIIILFIYILYICKLHSSSNKQKDTHRESKHTFFSQHKRPLSTPKHNCKMQFFLLQILLCLLFHSLPLSLFVHLSTLLIANENTYEHAHSYTHKHARSSVPRSYSLSLSDMKLSLDDAKRQQRERKYKCSANGFCGDVTVASVGDRWKR